MNFTGTKKIGATPINATLDNGNDVSIAAGKTIDLPSTNRFVRGLEAQGYIARAAVKAENKQESKKETD